MRVAGPGFDAPLSPGGYAWWYLDANSDDGRHGLCIIAFLGGVFSPYYAAARRRGAADPLEHCAFNVVLTGARRRWCMTERPRSRVQIAPDALRIGRSWLRWDSGAYEFELLERGCPWPQAVHGSVRVQPLLQPGVAFALDRAAHHLWAPLAPRALVEVRLRQPALQWRGTAYLDCNRGERALEQDFAGWQWSRAEISDGTAVFYETRPRYEAPWPLSVQFGAHDMTEIPLPRLLRLPRSGWGIRREARSEELTGKPWLRTLVDAPFYTRSLLRTRLAGQSSLTVHESLDLDRFRQRWVQYLLPFRTPRRAGPQDPADAS